MYCRVTEIKFDYTKKDEIISMLEGFRESMMALPGIQSVCTIETGEGEITSFAVYDTQENFNAASADVGKIMGFADTLLPLLLEKKAQQCLVLSCPQKIVNLVPL